MNKKKQNHEKWIEDYKRWKESGQTTRQFCEDKPYTAEAFAKRKQKLRDKGHIETKKVTASFMRIPVKLERKQTRPPFCTISFEGSGDSVIETAESVRSLGKLIHAMRGS